MSVSVKLGNLAAIRKASKATKIDFTNTLYAMDVVKMSNDHIRFIIFWIFKQRLTSIGSIKCPQLLEQLSNLCKLQGLCYLKADLKACYECGYFSHTVPVGDLIQDAIKHLLAKIRPQAVNMVESMGVTDEMMMSSIGNSYGDIYET